LIDLRLNYAKKRVVANFNQLFQERRKIIVNMKTGEKAKSMQNILSPSNRAADPGSFLLTEVTYDFPKKSV